MEQTHKRPSVLRVLLIGLAGAACVPLPWLLLAVPGLFGYLLVAGGWVPFLSALAVGAFGAWIFGGVNALLFLVCPALIALLLNMRLKQHATYFETALFIAALTTVLAYLAVSLGDILAGASAFYSVQQIFRQAWEAMAAQAATTPELQQQFDLLKNSGDDFIRLLPLYMPATLCVLGALSGLFNVLTCVRPCAKAGVKIKPMRRFVFWQLPKSFVLGALVLVVGLVVATLLDLNGIEGTTMAVSIVVMMPFAVQGLSVYTMLAGMRRSGRGISVVLIFLLVLSFPVSFFMVAVIGVLEQFLHLRQRIIQNPPGGNKPA